MLLSLPSTVDGRPLANAGYLEDLTPYVGADEAIQWDDIAPFFRDFSAMYSGKIFLIPLDGDFPYGLLPD